MSQTSHKSDLYMATMTDMTSLTHLTLCTLQHDKRYIDQLGKEIR